MHLIHMEDVVESWLQTNWPIFYKNGILSFHAPVGNMGFFKSDKHAKIIISGFCVAGNAGFRFVRSSLGKAKLNDISVAAQHTFDTPTMERGVVHIIKDKKIDQVFNCRDAEEIFKRAKNGEIPLMLTQALCPVTVWGSSKAKNVWNAIRTNSGLRSFLSGSLTNWWRTINEYSENGALLYLMGMRKKGRAELERLLSYSYVDDNNTVLISNRDQKKGSLLESVKQIMRVELVHHAAFYGRNLEQISVPKIWNNIIRLH